MSNVFERHVQTLVVLLALALLLWVGNTTQQTSIEVAQVKVEIVYLKESIEDLKND